MDLDGRKGIFTRITWQRKSCTNKNKFTIKNKESLAEYKGKKTNRADGSEEGRSMKTLDEILEPWGNTKHQFITMLRTTMQHQERNPWNHDGPETDRGRKGIEYQNPKTNTLLLLAKHQRTKPMENQNKQRNGRDKNHGEEL
jgi:hypothetical protein